MSVLSSPSPTLSPKPSFSHERSIASLRRSSSRSYRISPSSSQVFHSHASSPATSIHQSTPTSAPKRRADEELRRPTSVDVGTQYSPAGLPPTAPRPSMNAPAIATEPSTRISTNPTEDHDIRVENELEPTQSHSPPPPEPNMSMNPPPRPAPSSGSGTASGNGANPDILDSPTKRARTESTKKVMPREYIDCDVRDLGKVIADMLMELVNINDKLVPRVVDNNNLTRFHSRAPPAISVHDYINRLIVHATLSQPLLLTIVFYIDKLSALYKPFTIRSLTVHRYLITAATVAAKGLSDSFWTNKTYAKVGGITSHELGLLELDFLQRMDWKIIPPQDVLDTYYQNLVERNKNYRLEDPQTTAPAPAPTTQTDVQLAAAAVAAAPPPASPPIVR